MLSAPGPLLPISNLPPDLRYAKSHEWVKLESDGTATVGITDYAQNSLGDITFVQLPKVGAAFKAGESFGVVESVKAASISTLRCRAVLAVDSRLDGAPEEGESCSVGEGWMLRLKIADRSAVDALLSADEYRETARVGRRSGPNLPRRGRGRGQPGLVPTDDFRQSKTGALARPGQPMRWSVGDPDNGPNGCLDENATVCRVSLSVAIGLASR